MREIGWYLKGCPNLGPPFDGTICGYKLFEKSLLQKFTERVTFVMYLSLGSYILFRSMEADILKSKRDLYLVQKYEDLYFEK